MYKNEYFSNSILDDESKSDAFRKFQDWLKEKGDSIEIINHSIAVYSHVIHEEWVISVLYKEKK